jgi:hypothetical protein
MKPQQEFTTDLRFIVGGFMGIVNQRRMLSIDLKEDYELTIQCYNFDGGVLRYNRICVKHHLYTKTGGIGLSQTERAEGYTHVSDILQKRYPEYVRPNPRRPGEILLVKSNKK